MTVGVCSRLFSRLFALKLGCTWSNYTSDLFNHQFVIPHHKCRTRLQTYEWLRISIAAQHRLTFHCLSYRVTLGTDSGGTLRFFCVILICKRVLKQISPEFQFGWTYSYNHYIISCNPASLKLTISWNSQTHQMGSSFFPVLYLDGRFNTWRRNYNRASLATTIE